ncbi:SAM-dependent methyltransferase [Helicobacter suis]|uniref:SAM-dependent methyltransferase n=1 Tax=Helicobacter suis TaxID=104628 RepID=UPI002202DB12|nr:SAM-dependent methyltransferase [Helicobacter suis]BDR27345.1 hypothetical protein HSHS1_01060 [Helicobacter suis HS1]
MQSFSQCMQEWLYGENGYYRHALIGMQGDFYTAVNSSAFFGGTLAFYLLSLLENGWLSLPLSVVEIGAGEGLLLSDVVGFLKDLSQGVLEHIRFISVEPLDRLVNLQKEKLAKRGVDLECRCDRAQPSIRALRLGEIDVLIGINLLREGLDLPEVSLVAILDADKEGFLRSNMALIQTMGRAARHIHGRVIFYADKITPSMQEAKKWIMVSFDYGQYGSYGGISLRRGVNRPLEAELKEIELSKPSKKNLNKMPKVDFKLLETLFLAQGAHTLFYGTQSTTLLKMGLASLLELFHASAPFTTYQRESIKARALINPEGFGERFKGLIVGN